MARLFGIAGKASGKLGSMVFRVREGQQVISQYNPIVKNPKTAAQTDQRAKFKLMTQLSAIFANVIAIPTTDGKSGRNIFTKKNFPLVEVTNGEARVHLENLQLTNGNVRPVDYTVTRSQYAITVATKGNPSGMYSEVVMIIAKIAANGQISIVGSTSGTKTTADNVDTFTGIFEDEVAAADIVVYVYGINAKSAKAKDKFENIEGDAATFVASLLSERYLGVADAALTATLGVKLPSSESSADSSNFNGAVVRVSIVGDGSVVGAGSYLPGTYCTLVATPAEGAEFLGWVVQGQVVSTSTSYTFLVADDTDVTARFSSAPHLAHLMLHVEGNNPPDIEQLLGEGYYEAGTSVRCYVDWNYNAGTPGNIFKGWFLNQYVEGATPLSTNVEFYYTVDETTTLVAYFDRQV